MTASLDCLLEQAERAAAARGVASLRPLQREVLARLAQGRNVFAGLPTGYGKSLLYWLPAVAWDWRVWVVSPLVSLIADQALALRALAVPCVAWEGGLTPAERARRAEEMREGAWAVCLLSPERLHLWSEDGTLARLTARGRGPDLLVVDEMHCLEEWRDFRAGYRELFLPVRAEVRRGAQLLGLSASLAEREARAWMEELGGAHEFVGADLGRENLTLRVVPFATDEERWLELLAELRGLRAPASALVYCASRAETMEVARWLRSAGLEAVAYHAGLPAEERAARSRAFRAGQLRVVCATSAFGMGIDYGHVDRVIHFSMPHDLESYWQEVGRAGRGGAPARATAFWRRSEITRVHRLAPAARARFKALWLAWSQPLCRKRAVAERLGVPATDCGVCDVCRGEAPHAWWVERANHLTDWVEERWPKS